MSSRAKSRDLLFLARVQVSSAPDGSDIEVDGSRVPGAAPFAVFEKVGSAGRGWVTNRQT
ncbi:MAG: hypothetical protein WB755_19085 [Terriglobales bacterium]